MSEITVWRSASRSSYWVQLSMNNRWKFGVVRGRHKINSCWTICGRTSIHTEYPPKLYNFTLIIFVSTLAGSFVVQTLLREANVALNHWLLAMYRPIKDVCLRKIIFLFPCLLDHFMTVLDPARHEHFRRSVPRAKNLPSDPRTEWGNTKVKQLRRRRQRNRQFKI